MNKFLAMMIEDTKITSPTFFVEIVSVRNVRKINLQAANAQHVFENILTNSWLGQCVAELIDENTKDGTEQCRINVNCPISHDKWTIYYSDETKRKTH